MLLNARKVNVQPRLPRRHDGSDERRSTWAMMLLLLPLPLFVVAAGSSAGIKDERVLFLFLDEIDRPVATAAAAAILSLSKFVVVNAPAL